MLASAGGVKSDKKSCWIRQKLRRTRKKLGDPRKCNKLDLTIITNGLIILICNGYRFQQAEEENELQIKWTLFLFLQIINKIINTQSSVRPSVHTSIHLSIHRSGDYQYNVCLFFAATNDSKIS